MKQSFSRRRFLQLSAGATGALVVSFAGVPGVIQARGGKAEAGLVAGWSFDEGRGITALDAITGKRDPITYVFEHALFKPDSDPEWRDGIRKSGLLFDGYSTWIEVQEDGMIQPANAITLSAWVAPRSYEWGDLGQLSTIVNKHDQSRNAGYSLGMGRFGAWSFQLGIGGKWYEVWANDQAFLPKGQWSYLVATWDASTGNMQLYLNGALVGETATPQGIPFTTSSEKLLIGKHNQPGLVSVFKANMFNGLIDEVKIYNRALSSSEVLTFYQAYVRSFSDGTLPMPDVSLHRSVYDGDRYRPQYHFIPPSHWMNEPHAPFFFAGRYHLFYQHNPQGPYWHQIHWGHASSTDLVHWVDEPIALAPTKGSVAPDGVWSGSATVDQQGNPVLIFTAGNDSRNPNQAIGLATNTYPQTHDAHLKVWTMYDQLINTQDPSLSVPAGPILAGQFRDPFTWKDGQTWYMLVGSGFAGAGGSALLYTSTDLYHWQYEHPLMVGDYATYPQVGQVWELPVFLPLGTNQAGEAKHILLISPSWDHFTEWAVQHIWYWIGTWEKNSKTFTPDHTEPREFDYGHTFTGPSGFVDPTTGETIVLSITQDQRPDQQHYWAGWAHNAGIPVVLSLQGDNTLGIRPIAQLRSLRDRHVVSLKNATLARANDVLQQEKGDLLEIAVTFQVQGAQQIGLKVRRSPNDEEYTLLYYDTTQQTLNVDRTHSSLDPDSAKGIQGGVLHLNGEDLVLHVYLDRSQIEAYANNRQSITTRVYPTKDDALGVQLWSSNGAGTVRALDVWSLHSAYGETVPALTHGRLTPLPPYKDLPNHDFQEGNLNGWIVLGGNAFTDGHVTNALGWGWGGPFHQATDVLIDPHRYHYWGFKGDEGGDGATGEMKSQDFVLGGTGEISFLIAGGDDLNNLYVALVRASDSAVLFKETGLNIEDYRRVYWDASAYLGQTLSILVVDHATGGWGHINVDDINVPVAATPTQITLTTPSSMLRPGETITIEGQVKDAQNDPIFATVNLRVSRGELYQDTVRTLPDGSFHAVYTAPTMPGTVTFTAEVYGTTPTLNNAIALTISL